MKRDAVCLIAIFVISTFAAVAGKGNSQQDDNPKDPKTDKLGIPQDGKPKGKFRKVEADAVPGQYLVYLSDDVKMEIGVSKLGGESIIPEGKLTPGMNKTGSKSHDN